MVKKSWRIKNFEIGAEGGNDLGRSYNLSYINNFGASG